MAGMSTTLTLFSEEKNKRTSTYSGHVVSDPHVVIETRRVPDGNQSMMESTVKVVSGIEDSDGVQLSSKVTFEATVRYPVLGIAADVAAALVIFRDIIAGDEFAATVSTQNWL
jgi:mannitol/fructose-specific phosphotransferase system IIA component